KMRVRKVARNHSATWVERHDAERMQKLDAHDPYLEGVSWLSTFDEDRTGQWMRARASLGDLGLDGLQCFRNLGLGRPGQPHSLQPACDHGLDAHAIARGNPQHRPYSRIVIAPVDVPRRQSEIVRRWPLRPGGLGHRQEDETDHECATHGVLRYLDLTPLPANEDSRMSARTGSLPAKPRHSATRPCRTMARPAAGICQWPIAVSCPCGT